MSGEIDYEDFHDELQRLIDELRGNDFDVVLGGVEGEHGGIAFHALRDETDILVSDRTQTWFVSMWDDDRPDVEECWDRPRRVRREVEDWLDYDEE